MIFISIDNFYNDDDFAYVLQFVQGLALREKLHGHQEFKCKLCLVEAFRKYLCELAFIKPTIAKE